MVNNGISDAMTSFANNLSLTIIGQPQSGSYGSVYKVKSEYGKVFAVKIIQMKSSTDLMNEFASFCSI